MCRAILHVALFVVAASMPRHIVAQEQPAKGETGTLPLSLTGKAVDTVGRPVGGATICVVSTNSSPWKTLGKAVTGEDGRFAFRDLPLPETRSSQVNSDNFREGIFEVFGSAPGRAFAWQGMKVLYVEPDDAKPIVLEYYRKRGYSTREDVELDLTFAPCQRLHGRFVDEGGKPVAGVKLQLVFCDSPHPYATLSDKEWRSFNAIRQAADVIPDQLVATTDAEGKFELKSVPPEMLCELWVTPPNHAPLLLVSSTAAEPPKWSNEGKPVLGLPVEMTLRSVRSLVVSVIDRAGRPLAGVDVVCRDFTPGIYSVNTSDRDGKAAVKLPPGKYRLEGHPPKDLDWIVTARDLTVEESPGAQSVALQMDRGCILLLKAIDVDSGAGVPGVKFWQEITDLPGGRVGRARTSVQSSTSKVHNSKTDADGILRAVVKPGQRRVGIGWDRLPDGYDVVDENDRSLGRQLVLPAGQEVTELFPLRKTAK